MLLYDGMQIGQRLLEDYHGRVGRRAQHLDNVGVAVAPDSPQHFDFALEHGPPLLPRALSLRVRRVKVWVWPNHLDCHRLPRLPHRGLPDPAVGAFADPLGDVEVCAPETAQRAVRRGLHAEGRGRGRKFQLRPRRGRATLRLPASALPEVQVIGGRIKEGPKKSTH